jgi:hypothetical protein
MENQVMPESQADDDAESALEECLEEIDGFMETLQRYSDPVIAMSLRIHLAALLRAMAESKLCTREDVREFVVALEQEALGVGDA